MQSMSLKQQPLYSRNPYITPVQRIGSLNWHILQFSIYLSGTAVSVTWKPGSHIVISFSINLNLVRTAVALDDSRKPYVLNRKLC